jgi:hypothetical protein
MIFKEFQSEFKEVWEHIKNSPAKLESLEAGFIIYSQRMKKEVVEVKEKIERLVKEGLMSIVSLPSGRLVLNCESLVFEEEKETPKPETVVKQEIVEDPVFEEEPDTNETVEDEVAETESEEIEEKPKRKYARRKK